MSPMASRHNRKHYTVQLTQCFQQHIIHFKQA
ncbi:hypothetical protein T10_879 [Trichinella papuae]|uniref:Uncharacterized protein n=1 Tax=Trichinella papuae TaxID=268474 RepID=A0A0V1M000_9BILA|nr:hypothetical protein T10_879 [Trichinella papuae]